MINLISEIKSRYNYVSEKRLIKAIHFSYILMYMFSTPRANYWKAVKNKDKTFDFSKYEISQWKYNLIKNTIKYLFGINRSYFRSRQYDIEMHLGCSPKTTRISRWSKLKYTFKHKLMFIKLEYKLTNKITWSGLCHDNDKIFMYIFSNMSYDGIQKKNRSKSKHHVNDIIKTEKNYIQMIIDWESAHYTKPDKPLNAREVLKTYYPEMENIILPIIEKLGL